MGESAGNKTSARRHLGAGRWLNAMGLFFCFRYAIENLIAFFHRVFVACKRLVKSLKPFLTRLFKPLLTRLFKPLLTRLFKPLLTRLFKSLFKPFLTCLFKLDASRLLKQMIIQHNQFFPSRKNECQQNREVR